MAPPALVNEPVPSTTPLRLRSLLPPTVSAAFRLVLLARANAVLVSRVVAPLTAKAPLPRADALPRVKEPAFN